MKHAHNILLEDDLWDVASASGNASAFIADAIAAEHQRRIDDDTDAMMRHVDESGDQGRWAVFAAEQTGMEPEAFAS